MALAGIALACAWAYAAWLYAPIAQAAVTAYRDVHTLPTPQAGTPEVVIPMSVLTYANRQQDDWAKESILARARELYELTNDWGVVSQQLEQEGGE